MTQKLTSFFVLVTFFNFVVCMPSYAVRTNSYALVSPTEEVRVEEDVEIGVLKAPSKTEIEAAGKDILTTLAELGKISYDASLMNDQDLPEGNRQLQALSVAELSDEDAQALITISAALKNNEVPEIFNIKKVVEHHEKSWEFPTRITVGVVGVTLIGAGIVIAFTLYPVGMGMGLASHLECPGELISSNILCYNSTGAVVEASSNGPLLYCPEGFIHWNLAPQKLCKIDGMLSTAHYVKNISQKTLGITLGSIGGGSVVCCCSGLFALASSLIPCCKSCTAEGRAENHMNRLIQKTQLRDVFPCIDDAITIIVKRATAKKFD